MRSSEISSRSKVARAEPDVAQLLNGDHGVTQAIQPS